MDLGNKILNLRKKNNLSQEELAERVGVTRQTISKWELEETTPDINQAKILSKIFNVSLDELTNNDISNILVEKVSNTEKLAGLIIRILKVIGICIVGMILITIIAFILFLPNKRNNEVVGKYSITCNLDNEEYLYEVEYSKNYRIINTSGDSWIIEHTSVDKYEDANKAKAYIVEWFKNHNGTCIIVDE